MKEITELIIKLTEIQIREISDTWEKAKKIIREKGEEQNKEVIPK